jgi:hypothetical protein
MLSSAECTSNFRCCYCLVQCTGDVCRMWGKLNEAKAKVVL